MEGVGVNPSLALRSVTLGVSMGSNVMGVPWLHTVLVLSLFQLSWIQLPPPGRRASQPKRQTLSPLDRRSLVGRLGI